MKNKKIFLLLLLIPIIIFFIGRTFALPYTEEIRSIEIQSENYPNSGSFHIDKSAEWIDFGKARVTFDVNSIYKTFEDRHKDVILVFDVSESMLGEKFDRAKADAIELTNYLLSDENNSIALITFDIRSTIISDFIKDKNTMLDYLNNLTSQGSTNYNSALQNVDVIMQDYIKKDDTDLVTLFLTDGFPNVETPNEVATYHMLKDKYPYMIINGVQYEMGIDIFQEIINISDSQWVADRNTLHNVLFDATLLPLSYDSFVITDYINDEYFYVNSIDDVKVDRGEVSLEIENGVQKIVWNLGNLYKTGYNIKMNIDLQLKEEYHNTKGYYPTNKNETIKYKLNFEDEKTIDSILTPVLKNSYYVIYDTNKPESCSIPNYNPEEYYVYQNVTKKTDILSCPGYVFKGWIIDNNDRLDMKIINDDMFIMPSHNVTIRAIWTKQTLTKSTDGEVYNKLSLYGVFENEAQNGYARTYTGSHQDSYDNHGTKNIYYWYADDSTSGNQKANEIIEKNNVLFAGHCWQMIRTTDTGGVKLLYNGEAENDQCLSTRGYHVSYNSDMIHTLTYDYWYGTDFEYDKETGLFKLLGTLEQKRWSDDNWQSFMNKYTCKATTSEATCQNLYVVDSYYSATSAKLGKISSTSYTARNYSNFGESAFASEATSLAYFGYMYNDVYTLNSYDKSYTEEVFHSDSSNVTSFYISSEFNWNEETKTYSLVSPYRTSNANNAYGKYTLLSRNSNSNESDTLYYIADIGYSRPYYIPMKNGQTEYNNTYIYGSSYVEKNGGYSIVSPRSFHALDKTQLWNINNKYVCKNPSSIEDNLCDEIWYVYSYNDVLNFKYVTTLEKYKYGSSFRYENGVYKLENTVDIWRITNDKNLFNTHHYTCFNTSGECEQLAYIYRTEDYNDRSVPEYILLSNGENINDAVNKMLYDNNVNLKDSTIKRNVELWYDHYMKKYSKYIEDTVFCYDRSQTNSSTNGWNSNGGSISTPMYFGSSTGLKCTRETDRFSLTNEKAKIKYPVGILNYEEENILNNSIIRGSAYSNIIYAPYMMAHWAYSIYIYTNGNIIRDYNNLTYAKGLRPVISLKYSAEYYDGDGSKMNPYKILTEDVD